MVRVRPKANGIDHGRGLTRKDEAVRAQGTRKTNIKSQNAVSIDPFRKLMKRKQELLQNLTKVKPETGLAVSHQRVFLKQYLEDIRVLNAELEESNKKYSNLELEYSRAATKLKNTVSDLKVATTANFKSI